MAGGGRCAPATPQTAPNLSPSEGGSGGDRGATRPSQITIALADVNGQFLSQEILPTHATAKAAVAAIDSLVEETVSLVPPKAMEGIGVSLTGRAHHPTGRLTLARNLKWAGEDLKTPLIAGTVCSGVAGPDGARAGGGQRHFSAASPKKSGRPKPPAFPGL